MFCKYTNNFYIMSLPPDKTDSSLSNEFNFPSSYTKENRSITSLSLGESQYLPSLIKTHPQAVKSVKMVRQETLQLPQLSTHKICRVRAAEMKSGLASPQTLLQQAAPNSTGDREREKLKAEFCRGDMQMSCAF